MLLILVVSQRDEKDDCRSMQAHLFVAATRDAPGLLLNSPLEDEGAARRQAQSYGVRVRCRTRRAPLGAPHALALK